MSTDIMTTATLVVPPPAPLERVHLPIYIEEDLLIPGWVVDLESFRRWARSDEFPTTGRYSFIDGMLWVDRTLEQFFSHNQVKTKFAAVLSLYVETAGIGYFAGDGFLWTCPEAEISTEPDSLFFTYETLKSHRIRMIEGANRGYVELEGIPEIVIEIVSDSSVKKDTKVEKEKCARAGVAEYWLVDARSSLQFEIWCLREGVYQLAANDDGWLTSGIFGKAFKITSGEDPLGNPSFRVLMR
jgi:Uma2 family endonuclease